MVHFLTQLYSECSNYSYCGLVKVNFCLMVHFLVSAMVLEGSKVHFLTSVRGKFICSGLEKNGM